MRYLYYFYCYLSFFEPVWLMCLDQYCSNGNSQRSRPSKVLNIFLGTLKTQRFQLRHFMGKLM